MHPKTVLDNDYATLWYHEDDAIVHHQFHKFIHGNVFHDVLITGLEIVQKNNANKWLSDDRQNPILSQADYEWATENWVTPMIDSGWQYWAMVLPDKTAGKATTQRVLEDYASRGLTVKIFEDPKVALEWLKSVK